MGYSHKRTIQSPPAPRLRRSSTARSVSGGCRWSADTGVINRNHGCNGDFWWDIMQIYHLFILYCYYNNIHLYIYISDYTKSCLLLVRHGVCDTWVDDFKGDRAGETTHDSHTTPMISCWSYSSYRCFLGQPLFCCFKTPRLSLQITGWWTKPNCHFEAGSNTSSIDRMNPI